MRNYSAAFSWQEKVDRLAQGEVAIDEFYKSVGPLRGHVVPVDEVGFFFGEFFFRTFRSRWVLIRGHVLPVDEVCIDI